MFASQRQQGFVSGVINPVQSRDLGGVIGTVLIQVGLERQFGISGSCLSPESLNRGSTQSQGIQM